MTHIYDNNLKFLLTLNYNYEDFIKEPSKYYPDWDFSFYATQDKYNNPILSDGALREKTREELILIDNKIELLQDGESISGNEIKVAVIPDGLLFPKWNKELTLWEEGATKEEFIKIRAEKILKYSELEENKKALETSKFSSIDEIKLIASELSELEIEINNLAEKIKNM